MKEQSIPTAMALSMEKTAANAPLTKLLESIHHLRPLLEILQHNHFADVPPVRQYTIEEYMYPSRSRVPYLRIKGNWLAKSGFLPGQKLHIIPLQELLIICPAQSAHRGEEKLLTTPFTKKPAPAINRNDATIAEILSIPVSRLK